MANEQQQTADWPHSFERGPCPRPCTCQDRNFDGREIAFAPEVCDGFRVGCRHPGMQYDPVSYVRTALVALIALAERHVRSPCLVSDADTIDCAKNALRYIDEGAQ
jgi:hypothetical protein